tara:strand:- start:46116 stop:47480 length:1365 start_codon:yes stop_codon:yes gene_type:complete
MLAVAILAAGKGTRMKSTLPKVLQPLGGISLIERILTSCKAINPDRYLLIVGHQSTKIEKSLNHLSELEFIIQSPQNGTGHAIQQLLPILKGFKGDLLVLNGDVPLLKTSTIEKLLEKHRSIKAGVTLLSARHPNPEGYGRVFSNDSGVIYKIIEDKDCNQIERQNTLTNAGIYCFDWQQLSPILSKLSSNNSQNEIYLTDAVTQITKAIHLEVDDPNEVNGINNRLQMANCEKLLQKNLRDHWMQEGVTFIDPESCTLSEECNFGHDVVIEPQTHLRGSCEIGHKCRLGPGSLIQNSVLGENVTVIQSVLNDVKIKNHVTVGPFAHLRPGAEISNYCKIGNFVEIKKSVIGEMSNVSHLSYIGDSDLGRKVNIGAGTITANFDGINKHKTIIGDNSKTGANSALVAPITIGTNVTIGAGSTISKNVPNNALAIERGNQTVQENWVKKKNIQSE